MDMKFIVDINVGKLAKWLRIMGYDALLFQGKDDGDMVKIALRQDRIILTKDTGIMRRRLVTGGKLKALLIEGENSELQIQQVADTLGLDFYFNPFSICLECNERLIETGKDSLERSVPPYVYKTYDFYMQCPSCRRVYWRGTHWEATSRKLDEFAANKIPPGLT